MSGRAAADTADVTISLQHLFAPEVVAAIEQLVDRRVERKLAELGRDDWLPVADAARLLGCSQAALRERIRRGAVPCSRMSRRLYVKRSDINEALERQRR